LLPSLLRASNAPLGAGGLLRGAKACYRALLRLHGQDLHLQEQHVFQDAPHECSTKQKSDRFARGRKTPLGETCPLRAACLGVWRGRGTEFGECRFGPGRGNKMCIARTSAPPVNHDALVVPLDSRGGEIQRTDIGRTPDGDQDRVSGRRATCLSRSRNVWRSDT
jgi:hypothetical protein